MPRACLRTVCAWLRLWRLLWHVGRGWWLVQHHFARWTWHQRQQAVGRWSRQALSILGVSLRVQGSAPAGGPVLLVSNHISWLDILVLNAATPARFVSKADVKSWPVLGHLVSGAGTVFIEREKRRDAMRVVHHVAEALQAGDVVAVFPEGTTGEGREVLPFHANLLQAAVVTDTPVVPVGLAYGHATTGRPHPAPLYTGGTTLLQSVWRTVGAQDLQAWVHYGEADTAQGRDRRTWSESLRHEVTRLLHRPEGEVV